MTTLSSRDVPPNGVRPSRFALIACVGVLAGGLVFWALFVADARSKRSEPPAPPDLFVHAVTCPQKSNVAKRARRFEELALLREDRYAYDARDGVRAVSLYELAGSCYQHAKATVDSLRTRRAAARLRSLINTDYAAARLSFSRALEAERWSVALAELRRLIRLTEHLLEDEYVVWLKDNVGRLEVRARISS